MVSTQSNDTVKDDVISAPKMDTASPHFNMDSLLNVTVVIRKGINLNSVANTRESAKKGCHTQLILFRQTNTMIYFFQMMKAL